jgi:outer membrane biosynthesis protein TonB
LPRTDGVPAQLTQEAEPSFDYDEGPKIVPGRHPLYPPSFVRSGRKAWAYIEYTVTADGEFESVRVIQTSDKKFSGHIAAVIRRSKFQPAMLAGKPVRGTVRARFTLE